MRSWLMGSAALLMASMTTACHSDIINDNWGTAGYARLQGTVSHADGSRFGSVGLSYLCGDPAPTWFGGAITTDAQGTFDVAVDAPAAGMLPSSGVLVCEVLLSSPVPVARVRATATFSQDAASRPITTFTLVEGQGIP